MNRWHLIVLVICVGVIHAVLIYTPNTPIDFRLVMESSKISGVLGGILLVFELWLWRLPILHSWFVSNPNIRGVWEIDARIEWSNEHGNNPFIGRGTLNVKQTFSTIHVSVDWDNGSNMRFLTNVPLSSKDGFCNCSAVYQFKPEKDSPYPIAPRYAGFFFHSESRCPKSIDVHYSTTDNQVGHIELRNRKKLGFWRMLAPY